MAEDKEEMTNVVLSAFGGMLISQPMKVPVLSSGEVIITTATTTNNPFDIAKAYYEGKTDAVSNDDRMYRSMIFMYKGQTMNVGGEVIKILELAMFVDNKAEDIDEAKADAEKKDDKTVLRIVPKGGKSN